VSQTGTPRKPTAPIQRSKRSPGDIFPPVTFLAFSGSVSDRHTYTNGSLQKILLNLKVPSICGNFMSF